MGMGIEETRASKSRYKQIVERRRRARAAGLCITCCKKKPELSRSVCKSCADRAKKRMIERRALMRKHIELRAIVVAHEEKGDFVRSHHLYNVAAEQYHAALRIGLINNEDRLRISQKLAYVLFLGDDPVKAMPWVNRVLEEHLVSGSATEAIQMLNQMSRQLWIDAKTEAQLPLRLRAIEIAEASGDKYLQKFAKIGMVNALILVGRYEEARQLLNTIGAIQPLDDASLQVAYYHVRASTFAAFGKAAEVYADFERTVEVAKQATDLYHVTITWSDYAYWATLLGDIQRAKICLERALLVARRYQISWRVRHLCRDYALLLFRMGRYESAREYFLEALSSGESIPVLEEDFATLGIPFALYMRDEVLLARCVSPEAVELAFSSGEPERIGGVAVAYAQYYAKQGDGEKVRILLHRALGSISHIDDSLDLPIEIALRGDVNDVSKVRMLLEQRTQLPHADVMEAYLVLFNACVDQRQGRLTKSIKHAEEAIKRFEALHWHGYVDRIRLLIFGSSDISSTSPGRVHRTIADLQLVLTEREQQIADLAIKGLTNRRIAEHLSIREHTVEKHMSAIMNRLGIRSRHQLENVLS